MGGIFRLILADGRGSDPRTGVVAVGNFGNKGGVDVLHQNVIRIVGQPPQSQLIADAQNFPGLQQGQTVRQVHLFAHQQYQIRCCDACVQQQLFRQGGGRQTLQQLFGLLGRGQDHVLAILFGRRVCIGLRFFLRNQLGMLQ